MEAQHKISERYLSQEEVIRMIALTVDLMDRLVLKILYSAAVSRIKSLSPQPALSKIEHDFLD